MSTVTRHLQVESFEETIWVRGDKELVKEFGKRFQREKFPCDYKEWEGTHDSMISTITYPVQWEESKKFESEYKIFTRPSLCNKGLTEGYEMLKMEIIHILEDQGFKIISTMFLPDSTMERIMMYKEVDFSNEQTKCNTQKSNE